MALSLVGVSASAPGLGEGVSFVLTGVKKLLMDFCLLEDPDMNVAHQRLFVLLCQSANQYVQYEAGSVKALTKNDETHILRIDYWKLESSNFELTSGSFTESSWRPYRELDSIDSLLTHACLKSHGVAV